MAKIRREVQRAKHLQDIAVAGGGLLKESDLKRGDEFADGKARVI